MLILAIESSCDETSVSVVDMGDDHRKILSNETASQVATHALYGGVVPEIAGRAHVEAISSLTYRALSVASVDLAKDVDAIAVTASPGLIGALLVGVNFAKGLAYSYNKPLIPVNHVKGHAAAAYFEHPGLKAPFFAMIVSGGHTSLTFVKSPTEFIPVGRTRDDAAGEAFDKAGRVLGLSYPGGAEMDRLASKGDPSSVKFASCAIAGSIDFSFSGLKSAVINHINTLKMKGLPVERENIAASFTDCVVRSVVTNLERAHDIYRFERLVLAGGVAANSHLRRGVSDFCLSRGIYLAAPSVPLCGDNGAMIGAQAYFEFLAGNVADMSLNARASEGKAAM